MNRSSGRRHHAASRRDGRRAEDVEKFGELHRHHEPPAEMFRQSHVNLRRVDVALHELCTDLRMEEIAALARRLRGASAIRAYLKSNWRNASYGFHSAEDARTLKRVQSHLQTKEAQEVVEDELSKLREWRNAITC